MINQDPSLFIYIYIEKKVYNIEGQLRGLQGSDYPKTCAPLRKNCNFLRFFLAPKKKN